MNLQPLHPVQTAHLQISGNVVIDPSAAIAPGAILRAAPNSKIIIAGGVCIGMGAILNAYNGTIEIQAGANLAPGVLIVGACTIGANACIGGITTIFNASVAAMQVIRAGSVLGDTSRTVEVLEEVAPNLESDSAETETLEPSESQAATPEPPPEPESDVLEPQNPGTPFKAQVSGRVHVDRLLFTLFPKKPSLNNSTPQSE
ncbi:MAG: transferase [Spirulinaceae cyanobacterium]